MASNDNARLMHNKTPLVILSLTLLLCGCSPHGMIKPVKPEVQQTSTPINQVKIAKAGTIIYKDENLNLLPSLYMQNSINIKSRSLTGPRLHLRRGDTLYKRLANKRYAFYATDKHAEKVGEIISMALIRPKYQRLPNCQGIRRDKETKQLDGFVIAGDTEYHYDLPKTIKWQHGNGYPANTKNHQEIIQFVGIDKQNKVLVFKHKELSHRPRRFGRNKHHHIIETINVPIQSKQANIGKHTINIVHVGTKTIRYKIIN